MGITPAISIHGTRADENQVRPDHSDRDIVPNEKAIQNTDTEDTDKFIISGKNENTDYTKEVKTKIMPGDKSANKNDESSEISDGKINGEDKNENEEKKINNSAVKNFSPDEQNKIRELKKIDRQTRTHEQAHMSAGAGLVKGGPTFSFAKGPDGKQYAIGGEVHIDLSPVRDDPQATIRKMQQVKRAALAPADPSPQDHQAASRASQIESQARSEDIKSSAGTTQPQNNLQSDKPLKSEDKDVKENSVNTKSIESYTKIQNPANDKGSNIDITSAYINYVKLAGKNGL